MKTVLTTFAIAAALAMASVAALAQSASSSILVTPDNFTRAETDMYFKLWAGDGALGKFVHFRDFPLEKTGVRPNRDTLYSESVFDLDAGPVTITIPDAGDRFMSMIVFDEDHYVHGVYYGKGTHTFTKDDIGTRYVSVFFRTLANPNDPNDVKAVHGLQDAVTVEQAGGPGKLEVPAWDKTSQDKVRNALLALSETLPDLRRAAGRRNEVDTVRHLIATASAWGLNPDNDAIYLNVTPAKNDGRAIYKLDVPGAVPVDAFWSITVYDATGHFQKNDLSAYSLNNITAKKSTDGSVAVQFGGCDGKTPNCLPTVPGWNYMVRLYRPRAEILDGKCTFPEARPAN
jgi:hypothetical protein